MKGIALAVWILGAVFIGSMPDWIEQATGNKAPVIPKEEKETLLYFLISIGTCVVILSSDIKINVNNKVDENKDVKKEKAK